MSENSNKNSMPLLINCDMGEWNADHLIAQDHKIMPSIDLCNIACGGHAGSRTIMKYTIHLANKNNVKVGAHPGYKDQKFFGRVYQQLSENDLKNLLKDQIDLFLTCCEETNTTPNHIKPHGALYHACNHREAEANTLCELIKENYSSLKLFVLPDSMLERIAQANEIKTIRESFLDRNYNDDLTLLSRQEEEAVLTDPSTISKRLSLLQDGIVETQNGCATSLNSSTTCIHGDNPNILDILTHISTL